MKTKLRRFLCDSDNKLIFTLFFPILVEQLIITMMGTVHSIMLASTGSDSIAAVSLVDQLNQFAYAVLNSAALGGTIVVSQYIGKNRRLSAAAAAEQSVTVGFILSLAVGLLFLFLPDAIFDLFFDKENIETSVYTLSMTYMTATAVSFPLLSLSTTASGILRGMGDTKLPLTISIAMGTVNAITAALCIFALQLGILGAGIAVIFSRLAGGICGVFLLTRKHYIRNFRMLFRFRLTYMKQILRIGMYAGIENILFHFGKTITQSFFIWRGTAHITANAISGNIFNLICAPGNSMSIVATTLVGRLTGAGEKNRSYMVLRNIILFAMVIILLIHILIMPFLSSIIGVYTQDPDITAIIKLLFILNFIFMPISWPASFAFFAGMKGAGDARYTTAVSIVSVWLIRVLFSFILGQVLKMGVVGVWLAMFFDWCFRAIFALFRFISRKWQQYSAI